MTARGRIATIGMFDGVHLGHQSLLQQLKALNNSHSQPLVVTFSNHPLSIVNPQAAPRLISTSEEKHRLLSLLDVEPLIIPFDNQLRNLTALQFITLLRDRYNVSRLLSGFNNTIGCDRVTGADGYAALSAAASVEIITGQEFCLDGKINSSTIRQLITSGNITEANRLLGHPYTLSGTIVGGKQIGRTIGFPTANLLINDPCKLLPPCGVYAADALVDDATPHRAVVNIGHRPTIDTSAQPQITIEAHIIGFDDNLYGTRLTLNLIRHLRDEQRFPSLDSLKSQITRDIQSALNQK